MRMCEETLGKLLEEDCLAVAAWSPRMANEGQARGRGLMVKIRVQLMMEGHLQSRVVGKAPAEEAEWTRARAARGGG